MKPHLLTIALILCGFIFPSGALSQDLVPPSPLELPEAELPEGTPRADHDIQLQITISPEGTVSAVDLISGVGQPWDDAAIDAAYRYLFTPALHHGEPIAVKVPFTYRFRKPAKRGRMVETHQPRLAPEPPPGFAYSGRVQERGTRTPQAGIPVLIQNRHGEVWEALTDENGDFTIYGLPQGDLQLEIFTGGFDPLDAKIHISRDGQDPDAQPTYYLRPDPATAYRTTIKEDLIPQAASVISLSEEEITKVAGTMGDPTRVVASLPGVSRSPFGMGYYVVRGANLDNTGFYIDGHPAIFLYHLLGGPGVIHPELVGQLALYPGGYPAQYGRYASSIIALETKDPPRDRWHLDVELDIFRAGFVLSVPFDDQKGVATVSLRRSYYDLLLPLITDQLDLSYTDYQARISYDFSDRVRGRFIAMGAVDSVYFNAGEEEDEPGNVQNSLGIGFHRLNLAFDIDLAKNWSFHTSAMWEYDYMQNQMVSGSSDPINVDADGYAIHWTNHAKWRPSPTSQVVFGLDTLYLSMSANMAVPRPSPIGLPRAPAFEPRTYPLNFESPIFSLAPFVMTEIEVADGLRLLPGVRLNLDTYRDTWHVTADPKLALRWAIDDAWTFKSMLALSHQPPQVFQFGEPFGDPRIPPVQGLQASLGGEYKPDDGWLISLEGFVQQLSNLAVPANTFGADDDGNLERSFFDTTGEGLAYGLELLVRKEMSDWSYGWLSYTLSRSERLRPDGTWNTFEMDQTHILNVAWSFRLGRDWTLGARFQFASGNPYYPVVDSRYDADRDIYTPVYDSETARLRPYHRLDLRLDKLWRFETWMLEAFLDIQNVYNAQNPESPRYSYDYRIKTDGLSLPFLPSVGIRMVF